MDVYRNCLKNGNSVTIVRDTGDKLGIFNDIDQAKSYAFKVDQSCSCSICTIMSTSSDPICIEANTDNDTVSSPRQSNINDLIIVQFKSGLFKQRFYPFWRNRDYDIFKLETIRVM